MGTTDLSKKNIQDQIGVELARIMAVLSRSQARKEPTTTVLSTLYRQSIYVFFQCSFYCFGLQQSQLSMADTSRIALQFEDMWLEKASFTVSQLNEIFAILQGSSDAVLSKHDFTGQHLSLLYQWMLELEPVFCHQDHAFRVVEQMGKNHQRKHTASYYTPKKLIAAALKSCLLPRLQQAIEGKTKEHAVESILALRICDPSCGSGVFLVAALDFIVQFIQQQFGEVEDGHVVATLIKTCLYGVDLNPMAVVLCRMTLVMELIQRNLPWQYGRPNILCGDALFGMPEDTWSIPAEAWSQFPEDKATITTNIRRRHRMEEELGRTPARIVENPDHAELFADSWCAAFVWPKQLRKNEHAAITHKRWLRTQQGYLPQESKKQLVNLKRRFRFFHWHLAFPHVFAERGGFDVVVGNPPWGQKKRKTERMLRHFLRCRFRSLDGILESFRPFVELSLGLLREQGHMTLVLPDTLLLKNYQSSRKMLLQHATIHEIQWWGQAFSDAVIDCMSICCQKIEANDKHQISVIIHDDKRPLRHLIPQDLYRSLPRCVFNLHLTPKRRHFLQRFAECPTLGQYFEVHEGVHSGNMRAELFVDNLQPGQHGFPLIVGGKEMQGYSLQWQGKHLSISAFTDKKDTKKYANIGRREWYQRCKILVRRTSDRISAVVDEDGYYCSNNFFLIFPKSTYPLDEYGLCALLNSEMMSHFFQIIEPRKGRVFAEVKIKHLREFPVLPNNTATEDYDQLNRLGRLGHRYVASKEKRTLVNMDIRKLLVKIFQINE